MTPRQRMTAFLAAVADLCDKHGIEISTECGCKIGFCTAEDATFAAADIAPFASCAEIRNAEIYPANAIDVAPPTQDSNQANQ
jgi:hypothetical protein